jgi:BirA family biotin operon repressor/biotin-[acetyl-CoA-carboxylase] ligase
VLIEMNAEATRIHHAVAGIGINVNHRNFPPELKDQATSLALELERDVSRQDLLVAILRSMHTEMEPLMQPDTVPGAICGIPDRLEQRSSWIRGKRVFVDEGGGYTGVTACLDSRGFLRVQTGAGMRTALSGGVRQAKG